MQVGERVAALQGTLADRVVALERAQAQVTQLQGLFIHGVCPECIETRGRPEIERARREGA